MDLIALFSDPATYIGLLTLTAMEIVLGIDNVVFISIVAGKLPKEQQAKARNIGLLLALVFRVALLLCISWIVGLVEPFVTIFGFGISGRDTIMLVGGLFLIAKSTMEIHHKFEGHEEGGAVKVAPKFWSIVSQIILLDIVFSFDSVVTAVGLTQHVPIMIIAVIVSLAVMLAFAGFISDFVSKHPTVKMLALSFLLMIGTMLVAEGLHFHIPKGYIYFAMAFSLFVEMLNLKLRGSQKAHI